MEREAREGAGPDLRGPGRWDSMALRQGFARSDAGALGGFAEASRGLSPTAQWSLRTL